MTKAQNKMEAETEAKPVGIRARRSWDVPKQRTCLCCRSLFESQWSGERICRPCKGRKSWRGSALG